MIVSSLLHLVFSIFKCDKRILLIWSSYTCLITCQSVSPTNKDFWHFIKSALHNISIVLKCSICWEKYPDYWNLHQLWSLTSHQPLYKVELHPQLLSIGGTSHHGSGTQSNTQNGISLVCDVKTLQVMLTMFFLCKTPVGKPYLKTSCSCNCVHCSPAG